MRRARIAITLITFYQAVRAGRPSPCRFVPSCSQYAIEAIASRGLVPGGWLALRRLFRCHPFGHRGFDPVPVKVAP